MSRNPPRVPEVLAAVDLGSNSFHLVVARHRDGQLIVIDRMREMVRLAAGVDEDGHLDKEVAARALACLSRFGQRLSDVHAGRVRVVGTSALRVARRAQSFLARASQALGHPIEIVAGREEARLIYSGVAHSLPSEPGRRLVVDIGGGSTELIIGQGLEPLELESVKLGCVALSKRFFDDGKLSAKRFERARLAARQELEGLQAGYLRRGWENAVGSSGTARAVFEAQRELDPHATAITPRGVDAVIASLVEAGHTSRIRLGALDNDRRDVIPGGIAVLAEVLEQLQVQQMRVSEGAMREGLLYDMLGRGKSQDARERTVRSMQQRYQVDLAQAARVEQTALAFFEQVRESWKLDDPLASLALGWAARLHEIGLDVAHSGYHRHGAYLLENADMPGFARDEQWLLSRIVGAHRRKLDIEPLEELMPPWDSLALYLVVLLRLAVLLHRSRSESPLPEIELVARPRTLEMRFRLRSFRDQPLTAADLNDEIDFLRARGLRLRVFTS